MDMVATHQLTCNPFARRTVASHHLIRVENGSIVFFRQLHEGILYDRSIEIETACPSDKAVIVGQEHKRTIWVHAADAIYQLVVILFEGICTEFVWYAIRIIDSYSKDNQVRYELTQLLFEQFTSKPARKARTIDSGFYIGESHPLAYWLEATQIESVDACWLHD